MSDKRHRKLIIYTVVFFAGVSVVALMYLNYYFSSDSLFSPAPTPAIDYSSITID